MPKSKVTVYIDQELRDWMWSMRKLTGRTLPDLFNEAIGDFRAKVIAEEVGCLNPDTGRAFVKIKGEDFPDMGSVTLVGGRPPSEV